MKKIVTIIERCWECPWKRYSGKDGKAKGCGYRGGIRLMDSWDGIPTWCELEDAPSTSCLPSHRGRSVL